MGRKKSDVYKSLTRAHLHAIGLVAVSWNSVELSVLFILSKLANTSLSTTVAMAAPSNFAAWLDMLRRLTRRKYDNDVDKQLTKICERLKARATERNAVVHAVWTEPKGIGIIKAAQGFGIPKRGLRVFLDIEKTPAEMRDIAKRIGATERELLGWWGRLPPASDRESVLRGLMEAPSRQTSSATHQTQQDSFVRLSDLLPDSLKKG